MYYKFFLEILIKPFLFFVFFFLFLINTSEATFKYKLGQKIYGDFNITNRVSIPLPDGEWKVIYRYGEHVFRGVHVYTITLAQLSGNNIIKLLEIEKAEGLSAILGYITPIISSAVFKTKRHGCVNRKYYSLFRIYKSSGVTHNCVSIKHIDTNYELYENDDPEIDHGYLINWAYNNNKNYFDLYLAYDASIYIPRIADRFMTINFYEAPQNFANYNPINSSESQSEFHPQNINEYENAKDVMNSWIGYISLYHDSVEEGLKIKGKYKLKFDRKYINKSIKSNNDDGDLVEMLKKLNELYKSNVLSKEEFNKAKEKLLNQYN